MTMTTARWCADSQNDNAMKHVQPPVLCRHTLRQGMRLSILCVLLLLSACAASPGMYMGKPEDVQQALQDQNAPPGALTTITPELIASQQAPVNHAVRQDVRALFAHGNPYAIGAGDILNIVVWNHPELALAPAGSAVATTAPGAPDVGNGYNVSADGRIQFPFLGAVKVSGMTEYQVQSLLRRRLAPYIADPQITVRIQSYRSGRIYIDGEVRNPGLLTINDIPMTLPEAISRAGGFTADADRSTIILSRDGRQTNISLPRLTQSGTNPSQILLRNGDMLRVISQEENKVFLLGDVYAPRAQSLHDGHLSLAEALGQAGGLNPDTSNPHQIYVIRRGENGFAEIYHLDAGEPTALVLAAGFELKGQDIVFVDPAPIVRWNRVINMILPSYGAISATRDMTR